MRHFATLCSCAVLLAAGCAAAPVVRPPPAPVDPYGDQSQSGPSEPVDHHPVPGERVACFGQEDKYVVNTDSIVRESEGKFFAFVCPPKPAETSPVDQENKAAERW